MNFRFSRFFTLLINFILGIFFFLVGVAGFFIPWLPLWQKTLIDFVTTHSFLLYFFSLSFLSIGLSIFAYSFFTHYSHYILLKTGKNPVEVDQAVIENYLKFYWEKQFPSTNIPFTLTIKNHSLQIEAHFPFLLLEQQKEFLKKVEQDFGSLFEDLIGYRQEVYLIASFQKSSIS